MPWEQPRREGHPPPRVLSGPHRRAKGGVILCLMVSCSLCSHCSWVLSSAWHQPALIFVGDMEEPLCLPQVRKDCRQ